MLRFGDSARLGRRDFLRVGSLALDHRSNELYRFRGDVGGADEQHLAIARANDLDLFEIGLILGSFLSVVRRRHDAIGGCTRARAHSDRVAYLAGRARTVSGGACQRTILH